MPDLRLDVQRLALGYVSLVIGDLRMTLDAESRDKLRELLDRAAMPGQPGAGVAEPEDPEAAVTYWRGRWADTANSLADAIGVIQDLARHAQPIAHDGHGFVSVGYTVSLGAVHRAYAWLQGASPGPKAQTWEQYEAWLAAQRQPLTAAAVDPAAMEALGELADAAREAGDG